MSDQVLAAEGGIKVGEHVEWQVLGFTLNVDTIISTIIAGSILVGLGLYLRSRVTSKVPSGFQLLFETVTDQVEKQVESAIGIRTAPFVVPLAVTLFFFILICNWMSILPHSIDEYVRPPTADANLTFALAFFVIILVHITGIRVKGRHYFSHFLKPYPAMLPLELVTEIVKPFTLSLRLFGNILSATLMVSVLALLPTYILWFPTVAWKLFDLFIGLLQAVIFAVLTIIYFGSAAGPEEE
ncbi:MAG: F0F1 ATP synthase subunit A [Pseudonocardiaceae bacterium]